MNWHGYLATPFMRRLWTQSYRNIGMIAKFVERAHASSSQSTRRRKPPANDANHREYSSHKDMQLGGWHDAWYNT